ncbi:MAG TPA: hypothetical protein RMH99_11495 [Sandaracinaceae bacterium LLY-WYZ-13_1]|nr:hypothetical protein [Sandaracinaceae bacterium LLY-WYZ-13_1]
MSRPRTVLGLALRLLRLHPARALLAVGLLLGALGGLAAALGSASDDRCRLERGWSGGDPDRHEALMIFGGGSGRWVQHLRDGDRRRRGFRWEARGDTLVVAHGEERRRLRYTLGRERGACVLRLDRPPFAESLHTVFRDR